MSQNVALIVFLIFILFLLRIDKKQYPESSISLWVPTIWFLLACSKSINYFIGIYTESGSIEEGSIYDRNILIILFIIGIIILIKRKINIVEEIAKQPVIIILLGFMLISIFWSDIPYVSFRRWIRNIIPIIMALIIASEKEPFKSFEALIRRTIYILIPMSWMLIKYYPDIGRDYHHTFGHVMWVGVASQKNGLAFLTILAILYYSWLLLKRIQGKEKIIFRYQMCIEIIIIYLTILLFIGPDRTLTYSATSLVALTLALSTLIIIKIMNKYKIQINANIFTLIIIIIIIYGTSVPFIGGLAIINPSELLNRSETLTGRSNIWASWVSFAMERFILGHGFGFLSDEVMEKFPISPHNGYLEIILNIGIIGLIIFTLYVIVNSRQAVKLHRIDNEMATLWIAIIIIMLVHNIAESTTTSFQSKLFSLMTMMLLSSGKILNNSSSSVSVLSR